MKKLEKEQLPKLIALGVVATGLLGYAAYTWLGSGSNGVQPAMAAAPKPAPPPTPHAGEAATGAAIAGIQLAEINHDDPFRPVFTPESAGPGPKPAAAPPAKPAGPPQVAKATQVAQLQDTFNAPPLDAVPGVGAFARFDDKAPALPTGPVKAATPSPTAPAPKDGGAAASQSGANRPSAPPAIAVTGILEGADNVAILRWNENQRQVVRVGDNLDGGFKIKAIRSDAVVLARGSQQWVIRLGAH